MVEGPADHEIVSRYSGIDLDAERIVVEVLHGADGVQGIALLRLLTVMRIPIFVLLDHVRRRAVQQALAGNSLDDLTKEECLLVPLLREIREHRLVVGWLPFDHVDIVRAVLEGEITWALRELGNDFIGWAEFDNRARAARQKHKQKFKDTFRTETGVSVGVVIRKLITADRKGTSPELHGLISGMLDSIGAPPQRQVQVAQD